MTAPDHAANHADPAFLLLGGTPELTAAELARTTGVPEEVIRRLWRALGFPDPGGEAAFTVDDQRALLRLTGAMGASAVDVETAIQLTRAAGQTMARLADWQVDTLTQRAEQLVEGPPVSGSRILDSVRIGREATQWFEQLLIYVWRRHLAAALARTEALGEAEEDLHTVQVTVGFADLVGFTALSNQLDQDEIGELVEIFEARCGDVVTAHRGRIIKTLGDSVLFVGDSPVQALEIAHGIIEVIGHDKRLPDVRLGLATGPVVTRLGDVFGPPVNLAARLTTVARRNRVITDHVTADGLPEDRYDTRPLVARPLRGLGLVEPVAVRRH